MTIKDYIKEELMKLIDEEKEKIELRLEMHGDVYEISCEERFIKKLEDFVERI